MVVVALLGWLPASAQPATAKPAHDPFSAPPLPTCDPMDWKEPTTLPALHERLTGDEYTEAYDAVLAKAPALTAEQA